MLYIIEFWKLSFYNIVQHANDVSLFSTLFFSPKYIKPFAIHIIYIGLPSCKIYRLSITNCPPTMPHINLHVKVIIMGVRSMKKTLYHIIAHKKWKPLTTSFHIKKSDYENINIFLYKSRGQHLTNDNEFYKWQWFKNVLEWHVSDYLLCLLSDITTARH